MIAITADLATVSPKVGPIDWLEKLSPTPKRWSSARRTSWTLAGWSVEVEIWYTVRPSSGFSTRWIFASP
jgi:hypothetical protein